MSLYILLNILVLITQPARRKGFGMVIEKKCWKKKLKKNVSGCSQNGAGPIWRISQEPGFTQTCGFQRHLMQYHSKALIVMSNKSNVIILSNYQKIRFWPLFPALGPTRFFLGNQAVTYPDCIIAPLSSCQITENSNDPISRSWMYRQTCTHAPKIRRKKGNLFPEEIKQAI